MNEANSTAVPMNTPDWISVPTMVTAAESSLGSVPVTASRIPARTVVAPNTTTNATGAYHAGQPGGRRAPSGSSGGAGGGGGGGGNPAGGGPRGKPRGAKARGDGTAP